MCVIVYYAENTDPYARTHTHARTHTRSVPTVRVGQVFCLCYALAEAEEVNSPA